MRPSARFTSYIVLVITIGLGAIIASFVMEGPRDLLGPRPGLFLTFAVLLLAAESRPVMWLRRKQGAVITAAPSFNAALLFLSPGMGAAVAAGLCSAIGDASCGRPPMKLSFNAAMMTVAVSTSSMLLFLQTDRLLLLHIDKGLDLGWLLLTALALLVQYTVNTVMVTTVVALSERVPVWSTIRREAFKNAQTDGVLLALGPVMVVVAVRSILLLPILLIVTILVLNTTRIALQRLHMATHDPLTGLPNRRLFDEQLTAVMRRSGRKRRSAAVMIIDLDRFKEINDTLGHEIGDRVLVAVAERLQADLPPSAMVARLGGDEFAIVLADPPSDEGVLGLGRRIHRSFSGSLEADRLPLTIEGSVGIAVQGEEDGVAQLMRRADLAMYRAKGSGGGVVLDDASSGSKIGAGRLALLDELGPAIASGQLVLDYQPIIALESGRPLHLEALVRWRHPELGLVPPGDFIPSAEQTDLIEPLTEWVLKTSLEQCRVWNELGYEVGVAVNLSAHSVRDLSFPRTLRGILAASGVHPRLLTLEITENTLVGEPERAARVLTEIRNLGVRLAIDDFGTGYSSLTSLRELPLDIVKIDRSFVTNMATKDDDSAIVFAVMALADKLGLETIAEGIEDATVLHQLQSGGCHGAQGYHIARPMAFELVAEWLGRHMGHTEQGMPHPEPAHAVHSTA